MDSAGAEIATATSAGFPPLVLPIWLPFWGRTPWAAATVQVMAFVAKLAGASFEEGTLLLALASRFGRCGTSTFPGVGITARRPLEQVPLWKA